MEMLTYESSHINSIDLRSLVNGGFYNGFYNGPYNGIYDMAAEITGTTGLIDG